MPTITELDTYLQTLFNISHFSTIDTINGLQVSNDYQEQPITTIAYAVDSSPEIIACAVDAQADMLLVHHGLYWGKVEPITHAMYTKISSLIQSNTALYGIHLPLDAHLELGNNAQLATRLALTDITPFGEYKNTYIGVQGTLTTPCTFEKVCNTLYTLESYNDLGMPVIPVHQARSVLNSSPIGAYNHNNNQISKIAIISGGGTREIDQAYENGADLYITGDASHTTWLRAKELGLSVLFAGHYFTEIWGVLALAHHLHTTFGIKGIFIDDPTEL